jgi:hypothetical protein
MRIQKKTRITPAVSWNRWSIYKHLILSSKIAKNPSFHSSSFRLYVNGCSIYLIVTVQLQIFPVTSIVRKFTHIFSWELWRKTRRKNDFSSSDMNSSFNIRLYIWLTNRTCSYSHWRIIVNSVYYFFFVFTFTHYSIFCHFLWHNVRFSLLLRIFFYSRIVNNISSDVKNETARHSSVCYHPSCSSYEYHIKVGHDSFDVHEILWFLFNTNVRIDCTYVHMNKSIIRENQYHRNISNGMHQCFV